MYHFRDRHRSRWAFVNERMKYQNFSLCPYHGKTPSQLVWLALRQNTCAYITRWVTCWSVRQDWGPNMSYITH